MSQMVPMGLVGINRNLVTKISVAAMYKMFFLHQKHPQYHLQLSFLVCPVLWQHSQRHTSG